MMVVTEREVLETAVQWMQSGQSVALATVIETWEALPEKPAHSW